MTELKYLDITKAGDGHIKVPSIGLTSPAITESIAKTALASFSDGAEGIPVKSLIADINPVQNLNGQSAPYPAGGGDNKFNIADCTARVAAFGLSHAIDGEYVRFYGTCSSGGTHGWKFVDVGAAMQTIGSTLSYKAFIVSGTPSITINSITYNSDNTLSINVGGLVTNQAYDFKIGVVGYTGTAPATWSPYSNICPITGWTGMNVVVSPTLDAQDGTTYPISWEDEAGTVYGGTLDAVTGVLTVDMEIVDLGTLDWTYYTSGTNPLFSTSSITDSALGVNGVVPNAISSAYTAYASNSRSNLASVLPNGCFSIERGTTTFHVRNDAYTSAAAFKTAMSGVQLVYELATPQTYQLTPQAVLTILGQNNIWADTGDVEVAYCADTKMYIDKVIAAL